MAPAERHHLSIDLSRIGQILDDALLILDTDGRITQVNQAAMRLFGESLVDRAVTELINAPNFSDDLETILGSDRAIECVAGTTDNSRRQFRVRLRRIDDAAIAMLLMDMTLQHNLEKVRRDFVANVSHELR